jgi:hypothetical protein
MAVGAEAAKENVGAVTLGEVEAQPATASIEASTKTIPSEETEPAGGLERRIGASSRADEVGRA